MSYDPRSKWVPDINSMERVQLKEELIRNRLVFGITNKKLSEKLHMDPELTLAKVRQSKSVKRQQTLQHSRGQYIKLATSWQ